MNTQKWVMGISAVVSVVTFGIATLLELRIINNFLEIALFAGHMDFVINCMLGVGASALVSLVVAIVSYRKEKYSLVVEYFKELPEVYIETDLFARILKDYTYEDSVIIPKDEIGGFAERLIELKDLLQKAMTIGAAYSPMFCSKKLQMRKKKGLEYCEHIFSSECTGLYWECKLSYEFMERWRLKNNTEGEKATFYTEMVKRLNNVVAAVGANSDFDEARKMLFEEVTKYLKIEDKN